MDRIRTCTALVIAHLALAACGRGESAQDRQFAQLRDELGRVQADRDKVDQRLNALEVDLDDNGKPAGSPKVSSAAATPPLRVVRLSPDGSEEAQGSSETAGALNGEDPDDTTPRPTLRVAGVPGSASRGRRSTKGAPLESVRETVEQTIPDEATNGGASGPAIRAGAPRPSALDPEAKRSYDAALALVNAHKYGEALDSFAAFLVKWPDHPNADNATYWRGECYFAQGDFARASEQFEGTIARFPLGNKVPDALLKLGICQSKLGNPTKARASFERLQREFPRSEAARRVPQEK